MQLKTRFSKKRFNKKEQILINDDLCVKIVEYNEKSIVIFMMMMFIFIYEK